MRHAFVAVDQRGVEIRVLVDGHRPFAAVGGRDESQAPALRRGVEVLFLVRRRDAGDTRLDPDLQEVDEVRPRRVELGVAHARAGAHALHVAGTDHGTVAHRILVLQRAPQHVGDDFHVAMRVLSEARAGRDLVIIDHAQAAETHVRRVVVAREGKCVVTVQPAVVGVAPFICFS